MSGSDGSNDNKAKQDQVTPASQINDRDESVFMSNGDDYIMSLESSLQNYMVSQIHSEAGLLYFDVKLSGKTFKSLLDCGASREFINDSTARSHGLARKDLQHPFNVKLADGTVLTCSEYIPSIKLRLKQFDHRCDLFILDLKGEHDIILGQTFLRRRNPIIDWCTGEMQLRKHLHDNSVTTTSQ